MGVVVPWPRMIRDIAAFSEAPMSFIARAQPVRTSGYASRFGLSDGRAHDELARMRAQGLLASRSISGERFPEMEWRIVDRG